MVLTASALGLTRNESGRCFPHAEDASALEELRAAVIETLEGDQWERDWLVYDLEAMTDVQIDRLEGGLDGVLDDCLRNDPCARVGWSSAVS